MTYTIMAVNAGPSAASGLVVTDTLPLGFTVTGETSSQDSSFSNGAGTAIWSGLWLGSGQIATLTLTGTIDPSYSASSMTDTVTFPAPPSTFDPDTYNNTATVTNTVLAQACTPTPPRRPRDSFPCRWASSAPTPRLSRRSRTPQRWRTSLREHVGIGSPGQINERLITLSRRTR